MVRVMWSESSRRDAHNLDDTYERWKMRRETLAPEDRWGKIANFSEMFLPDINLESITSIEECAAIRMKLTELRNYLRARIVETNPANMGKLPRHELADRRGDWLAIKTIFESAGRLIDAIGRVGSSLAGDSDTRRLIRLHDEKVASLHAHYSNERFERQEAYIKFLRNSMANIESSDVDAYQAIRSILEYKFSTGDEPLFRCVEADA